MATEERNLPPPVDDWPAETWLRVRALPDDVPGAIRVRRWLKAGLRAYGIATEELTIAHPCNRTHVLPSD